VCGVEDAEALLTHVQAGGVMTVNVEDATHLHAAVVQVLLAFNPTVEGAPADSFLRRFIVPVLTEPGGGGGANWGERD